MMTELQSYKAKGIRTQKNGPRKLNASELDELWDEVQAKSRAGLGWKVPEEIAKALALK